MKHEHLLKVILSPYMSEKAALAAEKRGEYVFEIAHGATKPDVKSAVELLFKVDVANVRVVNVKTKPKRFGNVQGRSKAWKKALYHAKQCQFPRKYNGPERAGVHPHNCNNCLRLFKRRNKARPLGFLRPVH